MIASNSRIRTDLESSPSIENSGLTLVSAPLTGDNYLCGSKAVRFALGAKKKLSFIDGRSVRPTNNSEELDEWIRIDCMIITWILNSVSKEIVDAFIYATSARALWLELEARLRKLQVQVHLPDTNNGVVYQLQHRDSRKDKRAMFCEHCRKSGHLKETCFKLHGTPEWYRDLTEKKRKGAGRGREFVAAIETIPEQSSQLQIAPKPNLADLLRTEIRKMMIEENTSLHQMRTPLDNNIRIYFARLEELDEATASYSVSHSETNDSASLWHMRLGHSSFDALTHIPSIKFKQASLPDKFWGDCVLTATYFINRTPSKLLNWLTPYELLLSQPPSYAHLRVFGCLCFATNTKPHRAKFDKRSSKCVFLGYPLGQKGFKLFDLISQTYLVSRDVVFYENVFPFSDSPTSRSSCPLPIVLDPIDASIQYPTSPSFPSPVGSPTPHTVDFSPPISDPITTSPVQPSLLHPNQAPRRSTRHISKPQWLTDFICHYTNQSHIPDLMPSYECFVAALSTLQEPQSYKQAIGKPEWEDAMHQELLGSLMPLHRLDVNNAFLHGYLDELPPEDTFVAMLIYVDDVLIISPSVSLLTDIKSYLDGLFTIKDLGVAHYFLGLQIARSPTGTSVTQTKYINDIVRDTGLMHAKSVTTPFPQHIKLSATGGAVLSDPEPYRRLVGRLLILGFTRPDISYGVQQLSQFLQHPFPFNCKPIVMPTGPLVLILVSQFLVFVSSLGLRLFPGNRRNRLLFLALQLRLNIVAWVQRYVNSCGFPTFYKILVFLRIRPFFVL
ncbi:UNVERIFIED_CONTAM: Retrovirus-related Pol polyprotein from transposon RE1 [Sesamum radiatum]|uniref:Retrovirus-related Pol polyprotein from transposon RE1 n=1 Tax=Sesamum radiatum TaxID=300843 RepID=A0AAW2S4X2_SESRA